MATTAEKETISKQFEPIIEALKKKLQPVPEPLEFNHCIDVFSKWRGNFFYIMHKYKVRGNGKKDFFDVGSARLEFYGKDRVNLSYFRHTGKWELPFMYEDISLESAKKEILDDSMCMFSIS